MRDKKTIKIEDLKKRVNDFILNSADNMTESRSIMGAHLGSVLHDTGNYNGFGYLYKQEMKESESGTTVGIHCGNGNPLCPHEDYELRFKDTDRTRVYYF